MGPETKNGLRRPLGLWLLTVALLGQPGVSSRGAAFRRALAQLRQPPAVGRVRLLRLPAPVVGALMLRRHERARFSAYVFLSCEILRAIRIHSGLLGLLAAVSILYLQLPAARRFHPPVDPRKVM